VLAVQWAYAVQFGAADGAAFSVIGVPLEPASPHFWLGVVVFMLAAPGALAAHYAHRAQARLAVRASATQIAGDAR
jgi:branched-chain amino acid transport system permease protein